MIGEIFKSDTYNVPVDSLYRGSDFILKIKQGTNKFVIGDKFILKFRDMTEVYTVHQVKYEPPKNPDNSKTDSSSPQTPQENPDNGIPLLRKLVNSKSKLIEMPERGYDIVDKLKSDPLTGREVDDEKVPERKA